MTHMNKELISLKAKQSNQWETILILSATIEKKTVHVQITANTTCLVCFGSINEKKKSCY